MTALRRLFSAPGLVAIVWLAQLAIAAAVGMAGEGLAFAALRPFDPPADQHLLSRLVELLTDQPAVAAGLGLLVSGSALCSLLTWTLLVGLVIARLGGTTDRASLGSTWLRTLPGVLATSLWHLPMRGVLLVGVAIAIGSLPGAAKLVILLAAVGVAALALDIARAQVVLHRARGAHPRTAMWSFVAAVRHPRLVAAAIGLTAVQLGCAAAILHLGLAGLGGGSLLWAGRILALLAVLVGLFRITLVVLASPLDLGSARNAPSP